MEARGRGWSPVSTEPKHPLYALDGRRFGDGRLQVWLGPTSRFGARYFRLTLETGVEALDAVLVGLHRSGPLPSYNWIEVAETNVVPDALGALLSLLFEVIPDGGHIMVEYDSPQRAETAYALAHQVPPVATPLGEVLFRVGFGAKMKDWQIAEGGAEGPRKLQAYKPPSEEVAGRWKREAVGQLQTFLERPKSHGATVSQARGRAQGLLTALSGDAGFHSDLC